MVAHKLLFTPLTEGGEWESWDPRLMFSLLLSGILFCV